jgi:uncharacterized protein
MTNPSSPDAAPALTFDRDLFDLLVCPESRKPLKWTGQHLVSTDAAGRRSYRVEAGIPVMLIDQSTVLTADEWRRQMDLPGPIGAGPQAVRARAAGAA